MSSLKKCPLSRRFILPFLAVGVLFVSAVLFFSQPPAARAWRVETLKVFLRTLLHPIRQMPTPSDAISHVLTSTATPPSRQTQADEANLAGTPGVTPSASPEPLPSQVELTAPSFEGEDMNNCGPATLAMALSYYGWEGDQYTISEVIKPVREDRNVNIDEMAFYVQETVPDMGTVYRSGGDLYLLRRFLASGYPLIVETGMHLKQAFWVNDDLWAGHYLLLTGYDDAEAVFTSQDSYLGANLPVGYYELLEDWQAFNYLYLVIYPRQEETRVKEILASRWNQDVSLQAAMEIALRDTASDPTNAFAWFNLGSNLVYAGRYEEAATAFDRARSFGLPQRMLRYQFTPFQAYYYTYRQEDLLAMTEYALNVTPNSEEALLWRAWALYRQGRRSDSLDLLQDALVVRPGYAEAMEAIEYINAH